MGLTSNQTHVRVRLLGGTLGGTIIPPKSFIANALSFGPITSIPQGYNNPSVSLTPTIKTGGNISARFKAEASSSALLTASGNMAATLAAEADMIAAANVYANGYATFEAEADMVANLTATGNMAANMDILARPSAFDITQEVWAASTAAFTAAGTMGKAQADAVKAAKLAAALSA
jgi:hypothetical protein